MTTFVADLRAFAAAARKELRESRRYPGLYLGLLFWPVALPAGAALTGRALSGDRPDAIAAFVERGGVESIAGFVFVGYAMYMWLSIVLWGPGTALRQEQVRGTLEAVLLTPSSRLVILFGPSASQLLPAPLSLLISGVGLWLLFGVLPPPEAVAGAALVLAAGMPALYALGALFGAAVMRFGEAGPAVHFVRGMLVILCGVTFPLAMLPDWAHVLALLLPTTHVVDGTRQALFAGAGPERLGPTISVTLALGAVLAALAVVVFRRSERAAQRHGMTSRY